MPAANDHRLILCLEPEVACIGWMKARHRDLRLVANQTVALVADLGGGTADVTVHEVLDRPVGKGLDSRTTHAWQLAEVVSPAGDTCGSKAVDAALEGLVCAVFERCGAGGAHAAFAASREMARLLAEWEDRKVSLTFARGDDESVELNFCNVASAIQRARPDVAGARGVVERWNAGPGIEPWRKLETEGPPQPPPPEQALAHPVRLRHQHQNKRSRTRSAAAAAARTSARTRARRVAGRGG